MGNMPTMGVDPDGQSVLLAIGIGAAVGAVSGWLTGKSKGATGWGMAGYIFGGATIGALTAGVGNYVGGATAAWGSVGSGMASGAAAGFVGGGLNSTLAGGNFWQGAGRGALWGGVIGGAIGVGKAAFGANKTIGEFQNNGEIPSGDAVEFSRKSFNQFLSDKGLNPNSVNARTFLSNEAIPDGYKFDPLSKLFINSRGEQVLGTLKSGGLWQNMFRNKTNMYISEAAFKNGKMLYATIGHEFIHAHHATLGYDLWRNFKHYSFSERSAYDWTIMASKSIKLGNAQYLSALTQKYNEFYNLTGGGILPFNFNWRLVPNIIKR